MQVLVIGADGKLGKEVISAMRQVPGASVRIGTRKPRAAEAIHIDLLNPETFHQFKAFDVAINCADSFRAPPDEAVSYCLANNICLIETSADARTIFRLLTRYRNGELTNMAGSSGVVCLGFGIFPGLSNLVAAKAASGHSNSLVEIGIRLCPLSKAGMGMIRTMVALFDKKAVLLEAGQIVEREPVTLGNPMVFGQEVSDTLTVGLPEAVMLQHSLGARSARVYLSLSPKVVQKATYIFSRFTPRQPHLRKLYFELMSASLWFGRSLLLGRVETSITLSARVSFENDGQNATRLHSVALKPGLAAGGYAIAVATEQIYNNRKKFTGVILPDELVDLDTALERMRILGAGRIEIREFCPPPKKDHHSG